MTALSQMRTPTAAEDIFLNTTQPSPYCQPFRQVRPSAINTKLLHLNNDAVFGTSASVILPHDGDLLTGATFQVKLQKQANEYPKSVAAYYPIEALVKRVSLVIGGTVVDSHDSNWFRLFDQYVRSAEESQNYRRIANFDPDTLTTAVECTETLYLPMIFSFFRDRRSALPLAGLQNCEVRLDFTFASAAEVGVQPGVFQASVLADYVYVDAGVRRWLATQPIELMIEQVQTNGGQIVDSAQPDQFVNVRCRLGFRRPVKAIFWFLQEEQYQNPDRTLHARWVGDPDGTYVCLQPSQNDWSGYGLLHSISEKVAPLRRVQLLLNGRDRFPKRSARYFQTIQALQYCKRAPLPGSYVFAFSDDVGSLQPTPGLANFSAYNDQQLLLTLKKTTTASVTDPVAFAGANAEDYAKNITGLTNLQVYGWSYNICSIQGGTFSVQLND